MASYRRIVQLKYLQKLRERDKCSTNPRCKVSSSEDERCSSVESFKQSGNCLCEVFLKRGFITRYRGKLLYRTTAPPLPIVNTINCGDASVGKCRYKHTSISYRNNSANALSQKAGYVCSEDAEHVQTLARNENLI